MKQFLLFSLLFQSIQSYSQLKNDRLEYRLRPDSSRIGSLYLNINNFNYLRNYEFFNKFQDGYTLYGTQLEPQLVYYAHPKLALKAGVLLRKDFGNEGIYKSYPLFTLIYTNGNTSLINGALEASIHHRFIQPLFDFEKKITEPVEYGTQLLINKPGFWFDGYINWKKMIYKPAPEQEQIFAGASSDIRLNNNPAMRFSIPLQLTVLHQGGQIDTVNKPLKTLLNSAIGFKFKYSAGGFIKEIRTENYAVFYRELSPTKTELFSKGSGMYFNAGFDMAAGSVTLAYWNANGFISPAGMPMFQSVSNQIDHPLYAEKHRKLLMLAYAWQKELIPNFFLDFRVEPVMDLGLKQKKFEFFHSFFLSYRHEFKLTSRQK